MKTCRRAGPASTSAVRSIGSTSRRCQGIAPRRQPNIQIPRFQAWRAIITAAAIRAPSASNAQPWHIEAGSDDITIRLAPEHTSTLDVGYRASAVALGAALFNAKVAAAAQRVLVS